MSESKPHSEPVTEPSRRRFMGTALTASAGAAALQTACVSTSRVAAAPSLLGANERIRIACIGCGGRGQGSHMADLERLAKKQNLEIVTVCDVWKPNLDKAAERVQKNFGKRPKTTQRYMDVMEDTSIDAVTIATPDHAHSPILAAAARAGKHGFCEKPMADILESAKDVLHACEESGIVVQIGTQRRSDPHFRGAATLIKSGVLGTVTEIETAWHDHNPRWNRGFGDVHQDDVDWEQYLMHLPKREFDPRRYRCWHLYKDYTSGTPGLLGSHLMDVGAWYMEDPVPSLCVAQGGTYIWKQREHADTCECFYEYPKGFMMTYSTRLGNSRRYGAEVIFYGSRGTFDTTSWTVVPEGGGNDRVAEPVKSKPEPCSGHMENWLECMRSGKETNAPIRVGYYHSLMAIMAYRAMESGRRQRYVPEKEDIVPA